MTINLLKQNEIKRLREASKRLAPDIDIANIESIVASNDGYILTSDNRILMRMAVGSSPVDLWRRETKDLGLGHPGVTPQEAFAYISRLAALPLIEESALDIQRKAVLLRRALVDLLDCAQRKELPNSKQIVAAAMIVRETE